MDLDRGGKGHVSGSAERPRMLCQGPHVFRRDGTKLQMEDEAAGPFGDDHASASLTCVCNQFVESGTADLRRHVVGPALLSCGVDECCDRQRLAGTAHAQNSPDEPNQGQAFRSEMAGEREAGHVDVECARKRAHELVRIVAVEAEASGDVGLFGQFYARSGLRRDKM
ncbi:hypothetical protein SSBR45G_33130 [Bradyrhizobium sp. SSBR45G]|nr:hypothetical protein SSBR45G_33130 [Bradyrhizobium sp. SSBR45G]GLH86187.1 hypothetical protein SSBR45R_36470 [Bradyrhizobium sp. SSBR45R]